MFNKRLPTNIAIVIVLIFILVPQAIKADTIGQKRIFYVNKDFDKYGRTTISATLRHVGKIAYIYVEDDYWDNLNFSGQNSINTDIVNLASEFENNIYPKEVSFFGSEPNPGIDKDSHIIILLENLVSNNGGYFNAGNTYSKNVISTSNEAEMIVINADSVMFGSKFAKIFLAHEFQHLISFNQKEILNKVSEDVWLNELRSEYTVSLAGYNVPYSDSPLKERIDGFRNNPSDSLTEWPNENADYSIVNAFSQYLVDQFGADILSSTMKSRFVGIDSINKYLGEKNYSGSFDDVFGYWMGALYLNDHVFDRRLGFSDPSLKDLKINPQQKIFMSDNLQQFSNAQNIKPWQPVWVEYDLNSISQDPAKSFKISLNGQVGKIFYIFYMIFYDDGTATFGKTHLNGSSDIIALNSKKGLKKVVVAITNTSKTSGFGVKEESAAINLNAVIVATGNLKSETIQNGSLIKRPREKEVYVVWGKYKRYLNPEVISLYGHLDPESAIEVGPEIFDSYTTSNYVKYVNDEKVYAIWPDSTKHWLNITPLQWESTKRDWNAIFTVSDLELNHYKEGINILK